MACSSGDWVWEGGVAQIFLALVKVTWNRAATEMIFSLSLILLVFINTLFAGFFLYSL